MPGTGSPNFTAAAGFRSYVEEFHDELISRAFYGFKTKPFLTSHEGIKGKLVLTELIVADLIRRYNKAFAPVEDTLDFQPRELVVTRAKVELQICPKDFESSYLGMYRKKGQSDRDIPFEEYIINKVFDKIDQEFEHGFWNAVASGAPASSDKFAQLFDGVLHIISDLIAAGHTPVATPGGSITNSNALDVVEAMWGQLNDAYKDMEVDLFGSYANARKYWNHHIAKYQGAKPEMNAQGHIKLEYGEGWFIPVPGLSASNRLVMTPRGNMHDAIDDTSDSTVFNFEQNKRNVDFWMDFMYGIQVAIDHEEVFVFNDLA